jgi:3-oxoacyl-ACP reductase-like protein
VKHELMGADAGKNVARTVPQPAAAAVAAAAAAAAAAAGISNTSANADHILRATAHCNSMHTQQITQQVTVQGGEVNNGFDGCGTDMGDTWRLTCRTFG